MELYLYKKGLPLLYNLREHVDLLNLKFPFIILVLKGTKPSTHYKSMKKRKKKKEKKEKNV